MSQGIHHTNKWQHASVGSLNTFFIVFSKISLFWFDTFVQTFCVLLAGLLFLVSCAGSCWIAFNVTMKMVAMMIVIMMIIMTQVLPSRCTCCLGSRLPREAARPTDPIGRTSVRHVLAGLELGPKYQWKSCKQVSHSGLSPQAHASLLHSSLW